MECKNFRLKRIKAQIRRLLPLLFLFIALLMMILIRSENPTVVSLRSAIRSFFTPVISVVRQPLYWVKGGVDGIKNWAIAYDENKQLKLDNDELKKWRLYALKLEEENKELKEHLNFIPPKKSKHLTAEIVLDEGGAFSRSFVVSSGKNQGVIKGMLCFGPKALMGRIVQVDDNYSRVMPLTDYMSRVPVFVGDDKKSAFLIGDNTDKPYLQFPKDDYLPKKGDIIMTSGYLGVYPSNLPIGVVYNDNQEISRVALFEDINTLTFIRMLDLGITEKLLKLDEEP